VIEADLVIRRIGQLATLAGPIPRTGPSMRDLGIIENACVAILDERIVHIGPDNECDAHVRALPESAVLEVDGAFVLPGLIDAHTHLAYVGDRDDEIRMRLAGRTYKEIAAAGGGIVKTVDATRGAGRDDLREAIVDRLDEMLLCGTTSAEIKSGYGLSTDAELRSLEAIRDAASVHPCKIVPTFMGAHDVPREHRANREAYIRLVCDEMIPEVGRRRLATFCDVFCEDGVFTVDETRQILQSAAAHGMKARVHADELGWTGGAEVAAELGARSADHLLFVSPAGMRALADAGTVATLLPSAAFFLRLGRFAPARELIKAGVPVAIATDANPAGGLSPSLPFAMAVACFGMGLSLEEAVTATTINAAYSLDIHETVGSLEVGKRADLIVLRSDRLLDLLRIGVGAIARVLKDGNTVVADGRRL
jgi:imidazolonepropionase